MRVIWMGMDMEIGAPLAVRPMINSHVLRPWRRQSWFARILERLQEWRRRAEQRAELSRMPARDRRDIGLSDAQVWAETQKRFWQK